MLHATIPYLKTLLPIITFDTFEFREGTFKGFVVFALEMPYALSLTTAVNFICQNVCVYWSMNHMVKLIPLFECTSQEFSAYLQAYVVFDLNTCTVITHASPSVIDSFSYCSSLIWMELCNRYADLSLSNIW